MYTVTIVDINLVAQVQYIRLPSPDDYIEAEARATKLEGAVTVNGHGERRPRETR